MVSSLTSLRTVTCCFPVAEKIAEPHEATIEERTLLRQLARQQLRAERSARAAMAASERALPGSSEHAGCAIRGCVPVRSLGCVSQDALNSDKPSHSPIFEKRPSASQEHRAAPHGGQRLSSGESLNNRSTAW